MGFKPHLFFGDGMPIYQLFMNNTPAYWQEVGNRIQQGFELYNTVQDSSYFTLNGITIIITLID